MKKMELTYERMEEIINELVSELSEAADPDYLDETLSNIFTAKERRYFNI